MLWGDEWCFENIAFSVTVKNSTRADLELTAAFTARIDYMMCGWEKVLPVESPKQLREEGWLTPAGELHFQVSANADFSRDQPLRNDLVGFQLMWANMRFTDMVLASEAGDAFECHRAVLVAQSPVFAAMLQGEFEEAAARKVVVGDVRGEDLREFLSFLYTSILHPGADARVLLRLADMYELPHLAKACGENLKWFMTGATVLEDMRTLHAHSKNCCIRITWEESCEKVRQENHLLRAFFHSVLESGQSSGPVMAIMNHVLEDDSLLDLVVGPLVEKLLDEL